VSAVAPLTATQVFTGWSFDPTTATAVVVLAAAYLVGVRRATRTHRWPRIRTTLFLAVGLGSWVISTMSFLGTYDTVLFWPRAIQTGLLLMSRREHHQAVRTWGPTPSADQQMGGAAFWIIGDLSGLPFLAALFRTWVRDDEERTVEVDRALDAQEAAGRVTAAAGSNATTSMGTAEAEPDDCMQRPWWETDPARLWR
jgi:cytochrome c oxidase assembly factor CtaG